MYTVPKLDDYSPAALDRAVARSASPRSTRKPGRPATKPTGRHFRDRWMARKNGMLTQVNDTLAESRA